MCSLLRSRRDSAFGWCSQALVSRASIRTGRLVLSTMALQREPQNSRRVTVLEKSHSTPAYRARASSSNMRHVCRSLRALYEHLPGAGNASGLSSVALRRWQLHLQCCLGAARAGLLVKKHHGFTFVHHCMPVLISCPLQSGAEEQLSNHAIVRLETQLCPGPAAP